MQILTQYEYLDRNMLLAGVVERIVMESPLLGVLPFMPIAGNSFKYNVEVSLPSAQFTTVGTQLSENTGTYEQRTTDVFTLIQTGYTDKGQKKLNLTQDPETVDIGLAAKAMAHRWEKAAIIGRTSVDTDALEFKGLLRILAEMETESTTDWDGVNNDQLIVNDATGAVITLDAMDQLVDQVRPGKPDMILCSRKVRRQLTALSRAAGTSGLQFTDSALFGQTMHMYDGIPLLISDWILNNYPDAASSVLDITAYDYDKAYTAGSFDSTIIIAMQIGEGGVTGLQAGEMEHEREEFLEDFNAIANRLIWYTGMACFKKYAIAGVVGAGVA